MGNTSLKEQYTPAVPARVAAPETHCMEARQDIDESQERGACTYFAPSASVSTACEELLVKVGSQRLRNPTILLLRMNETSNLQARSDARAPMQGGNNADKSSRCCAPRHAAGLVHTCEARRCDGTASRVDGVLTLRRPVINLCLNAQKGATAAGLLRTPCPRCRRRCYKDVCALQGVAKESALSRLKLPRCKQGPDERATALCHNQMHEGHTNFPSRSQFRCLLPPSPFGCGGVRVRHVLVGFPLARRCLDAHLRNHHRLRPELVEQLIKLATLLLQSAFVATPHNFLG